MKLVPDLTGDQTIRRFYRSLTDVKVSAPRDFPLKSPRFCNFIFLPGTSVLQKAN